MSSSRLEFLRLENHQNKSSKLGGSAFTKSKENLIKCKVCGDRFSKYVCPACNLKYCSSECFKSQAHSNCSESFFKRSICDEINVSAPSADHEKKRSMVEILKRLESDEFLNGIDGDSCEDDENSTNSEKLRDLSEDELLGLLSPEQIHNFKQRLKSGGFDKSFLEETINSQFHDPWWLKGDLCCFSELCKKIVSREILPPVPEKTSPSLIYHVFSIILGYVFLIRRYGLSQIAEVTEPDKTEILSQLPEVFPVLFSDSIRPSSISDCFGLLLERNSDLEPSLVTGLMEDIRVLIPEDLAQPSKIEVVGGEDYPSNKLSLFLAALSDLHQLLDEIKWPSTLKLRKLKKSVLMKLRFLISFSCNSHRFQTLDKEILKEPDHSESSDQSHFTSKQNFKLQIARDLYLN